MLSGHGRTRQPQPHRPPARDAHERCPPASPRRRTNRASQRQHRHRRQFCVTVSAGGAAGTHDIRMRPGVPGAFLGDAGMLGGGRDKEAAVGGRFCVRSQTLGQRGTSTPHRLLYVAQRRGCSARNDVRRLSCGDTARSPMRLPRGGAVTCLNGCAQARVGGLGRRAATRRRCGGRGGGEHDEDAAVESKTRREKSARRGLFGAGHSARVIQRGSFSSHAAPRAPPRAAPRRLVRAAGRNAPCGTTLIAALLARSEQAG